MIRQETREKQRVIKRESQENNRGRRRHRQRIRLRIPSAHSTTHLTSSKETEIWYNSGHGSYQNRRSWRAHRTQQQGKCERDGRVPIQSPKIQIKGNQKTTVDPSKDTLKTLQSDLGVKGEFQTTIQNKNWGAKSKFLVIEGKMDSPPLLSKNTLIVLAIIKIDPNG